MGNMESPQAEDMQPTIITNTADRSASDLVACRYCASLIESSARICPTCRSYQGKFLGRVSYFASGLTIFGTISTTIAIIGLLIPVYKNYFNLRANLSIYPLYSDGHYIEYVIVNSGNRSASPVEANVTYKWSYITTTSNLETDFSNVVIAPGATMRFKSIVQSYRIPPMPNPGSLAEDSKLSKSIGKKCKLSVDYVDFDGREREINVEYRCFPEMLH